MHIGFDGETSAITGSCHILRANGHMVLLDCRLLQGPREVDAKNREPFPFSPDEFCAVVLSHGHIDHLGRIPLMVNGDFRDRMEGDLGFRADIPENGEVLEL